MSISLFENALKIKGYGSFEKLKKSEYSRVQKVVTLDNDFKVKPTIITSLKDYVDFITNNIDTSYVNPVFYRGQGNANYTINPTALRLNPKNENLMLESFYRRFSNEIDSCKNDMERLAFMQHFGVSTRALDITESPFTALYFACSPMKKFPKNRDSEMKNWGEIMIFREPNDENNKKRPDEDLKTISSTTVSVLSCTAFMEEEFSLWQLGMQWKKDNNIMREECFIPLKDIIRRSVIVRVPQNNPRVKNQQGAFIIINANEVSSINYSEKNAKKLTDFVLSSDYVTFKTLSESESWKKEFSGMETYELKFKKIVPYSGKNKNPIFDIDPFDLRRIFYKDENDVQQVVLIPPECKQSIIDDLAKFNFTEDFIYPDMDNVSNEIAEQFAKLDK